MKSGASDPFADEESGSSEPPAATDESTTESHATDEDDTPAPETASNTGQFNRADLPYKLRREKVKDERSSVHQLFVQDATDTTEQRTRRDLEDRFDEELYKLDIREAIYLAGMQNLDDAEQILREWGYDL